MIKSMLLTRTHEENEILKNHLKHRNINLNFISAPLLKIEFTKNLILPKNYNTFIFTSSYAVKAIKNIEISKKVTAFCIGNKTSSEAEKLGFDVYNANGDSKDLLNLIKKKLSSKKSRILYLRGKNITMDFKGELEKIGFNIEQYIVYVQKELKLNNEILNKIHSGKINSAAFFSSNSAKSFKKSVQNLPKDFFMFCLSTSIANLLKNNKQFLDLNYYISKKPNIDDFCDLFLFNEKN